MLKQGSAIGETALAMASAAPLKGRVICTNPYYKTRASARVEIDPFETHCYKSGLLHCSFCHRSFVSISLFV